MLNRLIVLPMLLLSGLMYGQDSGILPLTITHHPPVSTGEIGQGRLSFGRYEYVSDAPVDVLLLCKRNRPALSSRGEG